MPNLAVDQGALIACEDDADCPGGWTYESLDGVFVVTPGAAHPEFQALPAPTRTDGVQPGWPPDTLMG